MFNVSASFYWRLRLVSHVFRYISECLCSVVLLIFGVVMWQLFTVKLSFGWP